MSDLAHDEVPSVDGRRARRDRNREKVVDALLDLYREGDMAPPVAMVAARSGVSHRSVFRYFEDLDELCRVAIEREDAAIQHLIPIADAGFGPLDERIEVLLTRRSALYEATAPVARVGRMRAPRIPVLAENLERSRRLLNDQVRAQFAPELGLLPPDQAEAILTAASVLCSLESFELLRHDGGLSRLRVMASLEEGLRRLFGPNGDQERRVSS